MNASELKKLKKFAKTAAKAICKAQEKCNKECLAEVDHIAAMLFENSDDYFLFEEALSTEVIPDFQTADNIEKELIRAISNQLIDFEVNECEQAFGVSDDEKDK